MRIYFRLQALRVAFATATTVATIPLLVQAGLARSARADAADELADTLSNKIDTNYYVLNGPSQGVFLRAMINDRIAVVIPVQIREMPGCKPYVGFTVAPAASILTDPTLAHETIELKGAENVYKNCPLFQKVREIKIPVVVEKDASSGKFRKAIALRQADGHFHDYLIEVLDQDVKISALSDSPAAVKGL